MLTQAELQSQLHYNPESGIFTRLITKNKLKIGSVAGTLHHSGYIHIKINNKHYSAHRLAWLYVYGYFPKKQIDHINGNKSDNKICNLREATVFENNYNSKMRADNTSGAKGVFWNKQQQKWRVQIRVDGKSCYFGSFHSFFEAKQLAESLRKELHKEFSNNG